MDQTILDYYANRNAEYIHSKGSVATAILLENIDCKPNEVILEFGFGTAATLVDFASIHKKSFFFGIETNPIMYKKGLKRIKFCSVKNINVIFNLSPSILPYPNNFFDKVYAESVLAIQEDDNLPAIISEIYRVLKTNGTFIINEGIWIDTTSKEKINAINDFCKLNFGIIQSSGNYPYSSDWEKLLKEKGFAVAFIKNFEEIEKEYKIDKSANYNFLSKLFSFFGKIQSILNPKLRKSFSNYKKAIKILAREEKYMNGYLIKTIAVK